MRINGFTANILMFLFMFSIAHQSMASDKYESIAEKDKITIELNVNININGSDSKEIAPEITGRNARIKAQTTNDCQWGKWGQCSESCGNGFRERVRANADGSSCEGSFTGLLKETKRCKIRNNNCEPIPAQDCKIDLKSYGYDDVVDRLLTQATFASFWPLPSVIKINGEKVIENSVGNQRGFGLARINDDCSVNETLQFDTYYYLTESDKLRDYVQNLPINTRIAGITNDEYTHALKDDAKDVLMDVGLDLSSASDRSSLCFVFITGKPEQTKQSQAARYKGPATLSATI